MIDIRKNSYTQASYYAEDTNSFVIGFVVPAVLSAGDSVLNKLEKITA